jgi:hypothetical protein
MSKLRFPALRFLGALVLGVSLVGCGSRGVDKVSGTLKKDGKPYICDEKMYVQIVFIPEKEGTNPTPANFHPADGTFEITPTKTTPGLVKGRYKVAVEIRDYTTPPGKGAKGQPKDLLDGRYDKKNTQLSVEVDGTTPIDLDVK